MQSNYWQNKGLYNIYYCYPHLTTDNQPIIIGGGGIHMWLQGFDIPEETQFWYIIKDSPFDISKLKAKRRYEINKGLKNFETHLIETPLNYVEELYGVYVASMQGYESPNIIPLSAFNEYITNITKIPECKLFGVFDKETQRLCGYADIYERTPYLPISSLKTDVKEEHRNVNFALIHGILTYYETALSNGSYLCDGWRNASHKTDFQPFLEKYFGFRKAYTKIFFHLSPMAKIAVETLFKCRSLIYKLNRPIAKKISAFLTLYAWSKNLPK